MQRLTAILLIVSAASTMATAAPEKPLDTRAANKLIQDLASRSFQQRKNAARKLLVLGKAAVPLLKQAAVTGEPEQSSRAIQILGVILQNGKDEKAFEAAEFALMDLEESQRPGLAARVRATLANAKEGRHKFAVASLQRLGAKVEHYVGGQYRTQIFIGPGGAVQKPVSGKQTIRQVILGGKWKGGDDGLRHLRRLKAVPVVFITKGNGISTKAIDKLQMALPATKIQVRGKAFLGVTMYSIVRNGKTGCRIQQVAPASAAQKAGLKFNDVILSFDGKKTPNPDTLIKIIGDYNPEKVVKLEVIRGNGTEEVVKVKLGGWDD